MRNGRPYGVSQPFCGFASVPASTRASRTLHLDISYWLEALVGIEVTKLRIGTKVPGQSVL